MIPKRKRRLIVVNNTLYEYAIIGHISVVIHNLSTNELIKWHTEWKPKWKQALTPKAIREIIETGSYSGIKAEKG